MGCGSVVGPCATGWPFTQCRRSMYRKRRSPRRPVPNTSQAGYATQLCTLMVTTAACPGPITSGCRVMRLDRIGLLGASWHGPVADWHIVALQAGGRAHQAQPINRQLLHVDVV